MFAYINIRICRASYAAEKIKRNIFILFSYHFSNFGSGINFFHHHITKNQSQVFHF